VNRWGTRIFDDVLGAVPLGRLQRHPLEGKSAKYLYQPHNVNALMRQQQRGRWTAPPGTPPAPRAGSRVLTPRAVAQPTTKPAVTPPGDLSPTALRIVLGAFVSALAGVPGAGAAANAVAGTTGGRGMASVEEVQATVDEAIAKIDEALGQLDGTEDPANQAMEKLEEAQQGSGQQAFQEAVEKVNEGKDKLGEVRAAFEEAKTKAEEAKAAL
jgi:hypothetical protein